MHGFDNCLPDSVLIPTTQCPCPSSVCPISSLPTRLPSGDSQCVLCVKSLLFIHLFCLFIYFLDFFLGDF